MTSHQTGPNRVNYRVAAADGGREPPEISDSLCPSGGRPPDYVVVVSASDWVKDHFPAAGTNLWDALHPAEDRHRDPEPDLEAEP